MSILWAYVLVFILFAIAIVAAGEGMERENSGALFILCVLCFLGSIGTGFWIDQASDEKWRVKEQNLYDVHDLYESQVIFLREKGEVKVVNLNEKFGKVLPKSAKVKEIVYENGPYLGLYYPTHTELTMQGVR